MNGKPDWPAPKNAAASAMGRANPSRNTKPELRLRSALHRLGFRFRKHFRVRDGGSRPPEVDIAFTRAKVAVQVHGSFWHCKNGQIPKHNSDYWTRKFEYNVERDRVVAGRLASAGWTLVVVWDDMSLEQQLAAVERALHGYSGGHVRL